MKRTLRVGALLLIAALAWVVGPTWTIGPAWAIGEVEPLSDPAQEARARALSKELRCLVCQNQSIDDSNAPLARDLRRIVRERIAAGDDDREVKAWLVDRYGDFVLLSPPVRPETWALWFGPAVVLAAGGVAVVLFVRRRRPGSGAAETPLSAEERARLDRLLEGRENDA